MTREEIIEATIDYVMTHMRGGQSVNGTWVMKQDRDIQKASRYMKMPDPNVIEKRLGLTREEVIEMLESDRITLDKIYKVRSQRRGAGTGNAQMVKRVTSGLSMKTPKMKKYAKALYKDYVH